MTTREMFNTVLVHTSREWERIRLTRPYEAMPVDNIESVEEIIEIADKIMEDKVIKGFLAAKVKDDYFMEHTDDLSDTYIEGLAYKIINKNYHFINH